MNCKNMKLKLNHQLECKLLRKVINIKVCNDCPFKALKEARRRTKLSARSNTLTQLERKRTSLFTNDLDHCYVCGGNKKRDALHEIFEGAYRQRSMKEKMVLPLCLKHHNQIHSNNEMALYYKRMAQQKYEETHTREEFIKMFGRNYL